MLAKLMYCEYTLNVFSYMTYMKHLDEDQDCINGKW